MIGMYTPRKLVDQRLSGAVAIGVVGLDLADV
jgi:hypothetical protein